MKVLEQHTHTQPIYIKLYPRMRFRQHSTNSSKIETVEIGFIGKDGANLKENETRKQEFNAVKFMRSNRGCSRRGRIPNEHIRSRLCHVQ